MDRIDIITGTLGKALGGASGGYTSGRRNHRPAAPAVASLPVLQLRGAAHRAASIKALDMLMASTELRDQLERNTRYFRQEMAKLGFQSARRASDRTDHAGRCRAGQRMADTLLEKGVYVMGFSYPVVPQGRRASARRSPRLTHKTTWSSRWRNSPYANLARRSIAC